MLKIQLPSPIHPLKSPLLEQKGLRLLIKRDDLIHPIVSGNKWRKLQFNLEEAIRQGHSTVVSFGGAYSNHIHALAEAAPAYGLKAIGVIRGEAPTVYSSTLVFAQAKGMTLSFIDREHYKEKNSPIFIENLRAQYGPIYLIPEGGANANGAKGCEAIVQELPQDYDVVCVACGTGTTLAGMVNALPLGKKAIGFSALKGGAFLENDVSTLLTQPSLHWRIETQYSFGGYAKWTPELITFIAKFEEEHQVPLEHVYTGKLFYGLIELIKKDHFLPGTTIVAIHTGGLQGKITF